MEDQKADMDGICQLFLDELPEFGTRNLETLRQPLEDHIITISRAGDTLTFPANFMFVGAMNPCPHVDYGDERKECIGSTGSPRRMLRAIYSATSYREPQKVCCDHICYVDLDTTDAKDDLPQAQGYSSGRQRKVAHHPLDYNCRLRRGQIAHHQLDIINYILDTETWQYARDQIGPHLVTAELLR